MGMTAAELHDRMSGDEFLEHLADWQLSPWGQDRDDFRTAAIMEVVNRSHKGGKLTRKKAFESLHMDGPRQKPEMSEAQIKGALGMWMRKG